MEIELRPGTLGSATIDRTRHALRCGAMQPIATEQSLIDDSGIPFVVRKVSSLARKDEERKLKQANPARGSFNPFLPYEQDLFVASISDRHIALLNKFNVIDRHVLIVTREFEHQEMLLNLDDLIALSACMREIDGLGFYNGGEAAGASQTHKHLQLVPLPLGADSPAVPMERAFEPLCRVAAIVEVPAMRFRNEFTWIEPELFDDPLRAAHRLYPLYLRMLELAGVGTEPTPAGLRQSAPYNLLLTRRWMLLVPRSRECFDTVSVNALGFAGSLFVKSDEQLQTVKRAGPMRLLAEVAVR